MTFPTTGFCSSRPAPPSAGRRGLLRQVALGLAAVLVGGVLMGVAWRLLAPVVSGQGHRRRGLPGRATASCKAAQDGWLAVVLGVAGLAAATVQVAGAREPQLCPGRAARPVAGVAAAGFLAWGRRRLAGPTTAWPASSPRTPRRSAPRCGCTPPPCSPVGPFMFAVTRSLAAMFSNDRSERG